MAEIEVYFVATPIGNRGEMTARAIEILKSVDIVLCEDTSHSLPLLKYFQIEKPLLAYHKFNEKAAGGKIAALLDEGKKLAVITDAGSPCLSDPGQELVKLLKQRGTPYTFISGACAAVNAFALSGFSAPFTFVGFLPQKNSERKKLFEKLGKKLCLVFYSSVHDVMEDLAFLYKELGARNCLMARELTKLHETLIFGKLGEIKPDALKGEFVLVIEGEEGENDFLKMTAQEHLKQNVEAGLSQKEAVKLTAKQRNVNKNEIYKLTLKK